MIRTVAVNTILEEVNQNSSWCIVYRITHFDYTEVLAIYAKQKVAEVQYFVALTYQVTIDHVRFRFCSL